MAVDFGGILRQLQVQEHNLVRELARVRHAITAVGSIGGTQRGAAKTAGIEAGSGKRRRRRMSKEARAKISAAQKRRWAKQKAKA
jgi:hypothetical protein